MKKRPNIGASLVFIGLLVLFITGYKAMECKTLSGLEDIIKTTRCFIVLQWTSESKPIYKLSNADRENVRLAQEEFNQLPLSLVLLLCSGILISLAGGVVSSGQLKPISVADLER